MWSRRLTAFQRIFSQAVPELAIVLIAAVTYVVVRRLSQGSLEQSLANAQAIWRLEQSLHLNWEPAFQALIIEQEWSRALVNWVYIFGHWPVIICSAALLYVVSFPQYVMLRNAIFISGMIGFAFFAFMPTAPPRLADIDLVDTVTTWSTSYRLLQPPQYTNLYAAMPSLHFGWNLLTAVALWQAFAGRWWRWLFFLIPLAMAFAVVASANHFVLDVLVSLAIVSCAWVIVHVHASSVSATPAAVKSR